MFALVTFASVVFAHMSPTSTPSSMSRRHLGCRLGGQAAGVGRLPQARLLGESAAPLAVEEPLVAAAFPTSDFGGHAFTLSGNGVESLPCGSGLI